MSASIDALRTVSIFGGLSSEALRFLDERLEPALARAGETFFVEGDLGDSVFVLQTGRAEVVKSRRERSVVLAMLGPGSCFGEVALIGICPRTATVRAVTDCGAVRLSNRVLLELHGLHAEQFTLVQMNLGREIARRLSGLNDSLLELLSDEPSSGVVALAHRLGDTLT